MERRSSRSDAARSDADDLHKPLVCCRQASCKGPLRCSYGGRRRLSALVRSFMYTAPIPACRNLLPLPIISHCENKVIGTLFGHRRGHVHFSVQEAPRSEPLLLLELATLTDTLVKDMASGLVRIALECERRHNNRELLFMEQVWAMYCNGEKTGYAVRHACSNTDSRILTLIQAVSNGAGVLPAEEDGSDYRAKGELMYIRARFERVVGSRDSEALYMLNPDGSGGPELSIFLLRI